MEGLGGSGDMTAQPHKRKMTPEEYLALERSSLDIKHEFFNGEIFAMVGAKINHVWGVQKRGFKAIFFAQFLDPSRKNG